MNRNHATIQIFSDAILQQIIQQLAQGATISYPTETIYALSCDARNSSAITHLHQLKGRSEHKSCAVFLASPDDISTQLAVALTKRQKHFITRLSPGPITYILKAGAQFPLSPLAYRADGTLGVRLPDHPIAQKILRAFSSPIIATSCNQSGRPHLSAPENISMLLTSTDYVYAGTPIPTGQPSTVVDITGDYPLILRASNLNPEDLLTIWQEV